MTRKDYIALAAALKDEQPNPESVTHACWNNNVLAVANVLQDDNPRFDRERFLRAAGVL